MQALEFRQNYWDDREARNAFKAFILDIHGLNFSAWEEAGFWDERYTPFSYFLDGRVVSSVCMYLLDAVVNGRETQLVQISGVGTDPASRRRGLNRQLTQKGLQWAADKCSGHFLFADEDAVPFYLRCGFTPLRESHEIIMTPHCTPLSGLKQLDPNRADDRERMYEFGRRRTSVSNTFAVLNAKLLMFHCLYTLRDCIYEIPAFNCMILFKHRGPVLEIFDVVAEDVPSLEKLLPFIAANETQEICCHFHTDKIWNGTVEKRELHGNHAFTLGAFPVENPVFPFTARA